MFSNARDILSVRPVAVLLLLLLAPAQRAASSNVEDRFELYELMDRYGVVHDFGSPAEYADLFTADGEISVADGPVLVKGREALMAQAQRDHERFGGRAQGDGSSSSIMRHIITNRVVRITGPAEAYGSSYVITLINDKTSGPQILSFSRYEDRYRKLKGAWHIAHRSIFTESGNPELGKKLGFR
jgi:SnoaL-like domain